jgi:hypothetical protein
MDIWITVVPANPTAFFPNSARRFFAMLLHMPVQMRPFERPEPATF